jgi:hypothetical protein
MAITIDLTKMAITIDLTLGLAREFNETREKSLISLVYWNMSSAFQNSKVGIFAVKQTF